MPIRFAKNKFLKGLLNVRFRLFNLSWVLLLL